MFNCFSKFKQQGKNWEKTQYWAFWRCISCCFPVYLHVFPANLFKVMGTCDSGVCTNKPVNSSSVSSVCEWDFQMLRIFHLETSWNFGWTSHISIFRLETPCSTLSKNGLTLNSWLAVGEKPDLKSWLSLPGVPQSSNWLSEWLPNLGFQFSSKDSGLQI